jgi:hypothetical protein
MMTSTLLRTEMADTGNPRSEHEPVPPGHDWAAGQLALLASGIVAPLLYLASDVVSELNAFGSPTRPLTIALGLAGYTLLVAFGVGVWRSAPGNRRLRVVGRALVVFGVLALWAVPFASMHVRGAERSLTDTMHLVEGAIAVLLLVVVIGFAATTFGQRYRLYSIATILVLVAFGAWAGMDGPRVVEDLPTPWIGITERISVYSYQLWLVVLAIALLRQHRARRSGDMVPGLSARRRMR